MEARQDICQNGRKNRFISGSQDENELFHSLISQHEKIVQH